MSVQVIRNIKTQPREFGPAPWWAWMGEPTKATIDRDLKRFLAMEIYEVIIIPMYGLKPQYMGPEYFDLYRHTCRRCRQWGMKLWIYDEFNWPSGTCAGRALREHPEARQQLIQIDRDDVAPARRSPPGWRVIPHDGFQLAAYGADWTVATTGYLDTLNPWAVGIYIEMTHKAYHREVGEFFGDVVLGFFTDEPVVNCSAADFPYTPGLFDMFTAAYGYDLRPLVPALALERPESSRVRRDYWRLIADLFQKHFFRQYADWCAAHGLQMTGHLLHEESLDGNLIRNGDVFDMLSTMQLPGIDMLYGATSYDGAAARTRYMPPGESVKRDVTGKLIESVAYFTGKQRTLCEAFGVMANSVTLRDYKRSVDFLFHHGLSLINDNLFPDSLSSFRRFCGGHSFWTPWIKHYNLFARHIRAMSSMNSGSRLITGLAMYYPGADARVRYAPPRRMELGPFYTRADWHATQQTIHQMAHGLIRRHRNYYLMFDQTLQTAGIVSGGLKIRDFKCRVLIMPDIHYVDADTAAILRRFVSAGGTLICLGVIPAALDRSGQTHVIRWKAPSRVIKIKAGTDEIVSRVTDCLDSLMKPAVKISGAGASNVMATLRSTKIGETLFLSNFGATAADIKIEAGRGWRNVDSLNAGASSPLRLSERLLPDESRLFIRVKAARIKLTPNAPDMTATAMKDDWGLKLPGGNTLSLPMSIYNGAYQPQPPTDFSAGRWSVPRIELAPIELKPQQSYWLRREIEVQYRPRRLHVVVDGGDTCEVFVNRRKIKSDPKLPGLWDDANRVCDITRAIKPGHNEILIRYTPAVIRQYVKRMVPLTDLPPFVLRGDFLVISRPDRGEVTPRLAELPGRTQTGALDARGYPNFTGVAEYIQMLRLGRVSSDAILDLGKQNDLFDVKINGCQAGVTGWPPYRLPIGKFLRRGENRFVLRLHTALGGILSRYYKGFEESKPSVGLLETPLLWMPGRGGKMNLTRK